MAYGFDLNRLSMIIAVLEKKAHISFSGKDVWVNVAGGVRITEPAADLAVAAALVSSALDVPIRERSALLGEIGLGGEIRRVSQPERRLAEAERLGLEYCVAPRGSGADGRKIRVQQVSQLNEAIRNILNTGNNG